MSALSVEKLAANNIRILSAEAVQKANSGHPGMPMGCADFAFMLWYKYMRHNPMNPKWIGRDYFVLSAGHGSMLLYSLLHLFDYGLSLDEIKNFRQLESLTPGHPEFGHTAGVEVTTGPLASGFATAVGIAMEAKNFTARTKLENTDLFKNQKIYVMMGDGCIMEGVSHEAASLAGHLKLDNLICFYDSNSITIEGATSLAFSEDVGKRYEAYGWRVIHLDDANDIGKIEKALDTAIISDGRPTMIIGTTKIAYGAPTKEGTSSAHGEPLGVDELAATKKHFNFPETPFSIDPKVKEICKKRVEKLKIEASNWNKQFNRFLESNLESAKLISQLLHKPLVENLLTEFLNVTQKDKPIATRASSGAVLQKAAELVPALSGGSADLAPSTKTEIKGDSSFSAENRVGRNFHFGVREFGMGLCLNGMALYGTSIPYGATFLVFADYMKPAIKLAALQQLHVIYIFTHDSVFVGEDGPTHQPVEQLVMLRSIPGLTLIRPADANETAHAWNTALKTKGPVALILSRQNLSPIPGNMANNIDLDKGAYILEDDEDPEVLIIATGSEVELSLKAVELLKNDGIKTRVVSMPSRELFLKQSKEYQEKILPACITQRVSIELGSSFGWKEFVGINGLCIGIDHFGNSAPYTVLAEKYGFTPDQIAKKIKTHVG